MTGLDKLRPYAIQLGLMALHGGPWRGLASYRRFVSQFTQGNLVGCPVMLRLKKPIAGAKAMDARLDEEWNWGWLGLVSFKRHSYREGFLYDHRREWRRVAKGAALYP